MKNIKILYIVDSSAIGGAEGYIMNLARYLDRNRFTPVIVCPDGGMMLDVYRKYAKVYTIGIKSFFSFKALKELVAIIELEDVDIVHSILFTSDFCAALAACVKKKIFISTVAGFNFIKLGEDWLGRIKKIAASLTYRLVYYPARRIIAVSKAVKDDLILRKGIRVNSSKIGVIPCGISDPAIEDKDIFKRKYSLLRDNKIISVAATMTYVKGHSYFLKSIPRILKAFPRTMIMLIGDGDCKQALERESKELGISNNIIFTGYVEEREKDSLLALSSIIVLPSLSEGCPAVILEAMALKKPVVATKVGGVPELVKDGITGLLVNPKEPDSLSEAVSKLLSDSSLSDKMGAAGRLEFEKRFSIARMTEATSNVYEETFGI